MQPRLFRTSAFRLSLLYAVLYSLLSAIGLGVLYWSMASHIESQIDERLQLETEALLKLYRDRALPALAEAVRRRSRDDGQAQILFYRLIGPEQDPITGNDTAPIGTHTFATLRLDEVFRIDQPGNATPVRVLVTYLPNQRRLLVGRDLNDERRLLDHTLHVVLGVIAVTFLLAISGSAYMGYRALKRIDTVSQTAGEIMAGDLSRRIPLTQRDDEFDLLGRKLNAMLERIEQLLAGMRQVTDNIAHDLRGPLNRLRNRLDVTLLEARNENEYRAVIEQCIADADNLLKTFNALLGIAQAEAGVRRDDWTQLNLTVIAEDLADLYGAVAEDSGLNWSFVTASDVFIHGNRQLLAQAVSNLLDNAVKYTPSGGRVELLLEAGPPAQLSVADSGPGIAENQRERVLQRFVRLDNARSQPGNGLGLSLVKAVAGLHGAQLILADNRPGLRVTLVFPPE